MYGLGDFFLSIGYPLTVITTVINQDDLMDQLWWAPVEHAEELEGGGEGGEKGTHTVSLLPR